MPNLPWGHRTICQLSIMGQAFGQQIVNVHHFEAAQTLETTFTSDQVAYTASDALADAWIATAKTAYLECVSMDYAMTMVRAQVLERPSTWRHRLTPAEVSSTGAGTAGASETAEDLGIAGVLKWRTPQAGKSFRGRTYFSPLAQGWRSNNLLNSQGITALELYRDAMLNTWGAQLTPPSSTWTLVIYSRPFNNGEYGYPQGSNPSRTWYYPPDYAGNATGVTSGSADSVLRSQRRRQQGRGS